MRIMSIESLEPHKAHRIPYFIYRIVLLPFFNLTKLIQLIFRQQSQVYHVNIPSIDSSKEESVTA